MHKIFIEQHNANDDEVIIESLLYENGAKVLANSVIGIFETTKSTYEVYAENTGYFYTKYKIGDTLQIGQLFAILCDIEIVEAIDEYFVEYSDDSSLEQNYKEMPKITKKAELLAKTHNLNISDIKPINNRISEEAINSYLSSIPLDNKRFSETIEQSTTGHKIAVIGAGPSLPVIIDTLLESKKDYVSAIYDDDISLHDKSIYGIPVLGKINPYQMKKDKENGLFNKIIIGINSTVEVRDRVFKLLDSNNFDFVNIIHPKANISQSSSLGYGNIILQFCNISPCATIGNNNFLSAYTSIEHHCNIGSSNSFGPNVVLSGMVKAHSNIKFGCGIFIEPHLSIGSYSTIASGAIITNNIDNNTIVKNKCLLTFREK